MPVFLRHLITTSLLYLAGPAAGLLVPPARRTRAADIAALDAHASEGARPAALVWWAAVPGVTMYAPRWFGNVRDIGG